jgi:beta-glucanase (GH16 family)
MLIRRAAVIATALLASLLASACTTSGAPAEIAIDAKAVLEISPVDYNGSGVVTATFGSPSAGRQVTLQRLGGSGWFEVARGVEDRSGRVEFLVNGATGAFRAVAGETSGDQQAVATITTSVEDTWRKQMDASFNGDSLNSNYWDYRLSRTYEASGRHCSAFYPSNVVVADQRVSLSVTEETNEYYIAKAKAAGCKQDHQYRNGMISTKGSFTTGTGLVAAKVRFPEGQGAQAGIWLQSHEGSKIDFAASRGYGDGVINMIHVGGKRYPANDAEVYVDTDATKDQKWWGTDHVYSVEWDTQRAVFRIDGVITQTLNKSFPDEDYFLVIAVLTPDDAQVRFTTPLEGAAGVEPTRLPQTMSVDWLKVWTRI